MNTKLATGLLAGTIVGVLTCCLVGIVLLTADTEKPSSKQPAPVARQSVRSSALPSPRPEAEEPDPVVPARPVIRQSATKKPRAPVAKQPEQPESLDDVLEQLRQGKDASKKLMAMRPESLTRDDFRKLRQFLLEDYDGAESGQIAVIFYVGRMPSPGRVEMPRVLVSDIQRLYSNTRSANVNSVCLGAIRDLTHSLWITGGRPASEYRDVQPDIILPPKKH